MKSFTQSFINALFVAGFISFVTAYSAPAQAQDKPASEKASPSHPDAPHWTLKTQSGEEGSFSDFAGKPMIITFWGTWGPYCKKLHPGLENVRAKYEEQGLVVLGISVNEPIGADPEGSLKERGIHFQTLVDGDEVAEDVFQIFGTPTTLFVSHDGKILGTTMESNPDDPRFDRVAAYLVNQLN